MNKIFSFERFGKYFAYDLNNAKNNYGLSLLIQGCMPIVVFVFYNFYTLVFAQEFAGMDKPLTFVAFFVAIISVGLMAPTKLYGGLTDKKMGSDWILIPASTFEKFLSMLIVLCVVLPVILFTLFFASDFLISIFVKDYEPVVKWIGEGLDQIGFLFENEDGPSFTKAIYLAGWFNWIETILTFTIGAICFKKAKVGKTILVLWLLSCVFSVVAVAFVGSVDGDFVENLIKDFNPHNAELWINAFVNVIYLVVIGGLMGGLYYRLKTIKH